MNNTKNPISTYMMYAHEDAKYAIELNKHLQLLIQHKYMILWYDHNLESGDLWEEVIKQQIESADVFLVIVTVNLFTSTFIQQVELKRAVERYNNKEAVIIPILADFCFWEPSILGSMEIILPRNSKPISSFVNKGEAFLDIVIGIKATLDHKLANSNIPTSRSITKNYESHFLEQVFVVNGTPKLTFVEPEEYTFIKIALKQAGRGIVIEGPSGIGKTSIALNLLKESKINYTYLSARIPSHINNISQIENLEGVVIIDDFHRLENQMQIKIANYLKFLADCSSKTTKLIIIGIPNTGENLIKISFDLANRVTIFKIGSVDNSTIESLITKGETALNIDFLQKSNIVRESFGSLQVAQLLCQYIAGIQKIEKTQEERFRIELGPYDVIKRIIEDLKPKYDDLLVSLASIGGKRDRTCLKLIEELASSNDGVLNFTHLKSRKPELKNGINQLIKNKILVDFFEKQPRFKKHLLLDVRIPGLIIDDPLDFLTTVDTVYF